MKIPLAEIEFPDNLDELAQFEAVGRRDAQSCPDRSSLEAQSFVIPAFSGSGHLHLRVVCSARTHQTIGVTAYPVCKKKMEITGIDDPSGKAALKTVECPFMYLEGKVKSGTEEILVAVDASSNTKIGVW